MVYVKRQFNNTASLQMSQIWLKSYWQSRRLPKAAHFGPFQVRSSRQTPKPKTHFQNVLENLTAAHSPKMDVLNTSHHGGAGSSLGFRDTTEIKVAQEPFPEFTCRVFSEWDLLGCIWLFQPLPWVSKVKLRLFPPEQLHGQGVLQLSMSWRGFEKCRINEALLRLICLLPFDSVPCQELSCDSSFSHNVQFSLFIFHMNSRGFT